jgi:hypothetical protein
MASFVQGKIIISSNLFSRDEEKAKVFRRQRKSENELDLLN